MNSSDVDAMVRDVVVRLGLRYAVLSVIESPTGWNVQLRAGTAGLIRFTVFNGRPAAMRAAIQEQLEDR
jgi:hypothetical protein